MACTRLQEFGEGDHELSVFSVESFWTDDFRIFPSRYILNTVGTSLGSYDVSVGLKEDRP